MLAVLPVDAKKAKKVRPEDAIYPDKEHGWTYAEPEKYGFSSEKFANLEEYLIKKTNATGYIVIVGGECIFSYGDLEALSYLASCRKSVLMMLYGKYIENGTINLDTTIGELGIDDVEGLLPIERQATIKNILEARSGIYHPASNAGDSGDKPERGSKKPGTWWLYNNWDFNVGGTIFEKLTHQNIYDALWNDIGSKIDFQDWNRKAQRKGGNRRISIHRAYHFYLSTRDMARLGYLMLRKGHWRDQQVISEAWVKNMTAVHSTYNECNRGKNKGKYSYGLWWWLYDVDEYMDNPPELAGAYSANGAMGQRICVVPKLDMVIALKTDATYGRRVGEQTWTKILYDTVGAR